LSDGNPFGDLSDDDLVETGAALETVLADLTVGWRDVATEVDAEWPKTRKSAIKLGVNTTLALAGVAAAPVTFGLSLLLTVGSVGMIVWDGVDFARDLAGHRSN
jgi:hypothetical protein